MKNYNRLQLIKIRLCCFLDIHLYCNNLSTIEMISSLILSELIPACFSCNNKLNLSQSSLRSEDRIIVLDVPEAKIAGELSIFFIDLCLLFGRPVLLVSNFISFANS